MRTKKLSKTKQITGIIFTIITALLSTRLLPDSGIFVLAIAPFVIPAITAGIGMLGNLLGGDPEKERRERLIAMLKAREGDIAKQGEEQKVGLQRTSAMQQKKRRGNLNQKLAGLGYQPQEGNYSNEEDIISGLDTGLVNINANTQALINDIKGQEMAVEANAPIPESPFSKAFGGLATGANLGFGINQAAGIGLPGMGQAGAGGLGSLLKTNKKGMINLDDIAKLRSILQSLPDAQQYFPHW